MTEIILRNAIRCKKCGSEIESTSTHDFTTCACGSVSVDGGHAYLRRVGKLELIEELSETREERCPNCGSEKWFRVGLNLEYPDYIHCTICGHREDTNLLVGAEENESI